MRIVQDGKKDGQVYGGHEEARLVIGPTSFCPIWKDFARFYILLGFLKESCKILAYNVFFDSLQDLCKHCI